MFEVIRTKNDNKTVIENLGTMEEDDFIEFSKKYIGKDTSQWGTIFNDEEEILSDVELIKGTGNEMWFETEDTNLIINYVEKEKNMTKNAKEMFEEIGYTLHYIGSQQFIYRNNGTLGGFKEIIINNLPKTDRGFYINYSYENNGGYLSLEELKAINKQVEELGWLDD